MSDKTVIAVGIGCLAALVLLVVACIVVAPNGIPVPKHGCFNHSQQFPCPINQKGN